MLLATGGVEDCVAGLISKVYDHDIFHAVDHA